MSLNSGEITWSPASSLGANFCTHRISQNAEGKLVFEPTLGMKAFYFVFCFLTCITPLFFLGGFIAGEVPVFALLPVLGVTWLFWFFCKVLKKMTYTPSYFDKTSNTYYAVEASILGADKEVREAISSIKALQILSKRVHSSSNSYTAFELNLLLDTGKRRTVLSHASYDDIKRDAQTLSMHLGLNILEKE